MGITSVRSATVSLLLVLAVSPAFGTTPVARWDVVPWQRLHQPFKAGVVAFHETGVKVAFSVRSNGAEIATAVAENPTLNDRVNVWEYWVELKPAALPAGPLVVHATALPLGEGHEPLELAPLHLTVRKAPPIRQPVWVDCTHGSDAAAGTEAAPLQSLAAAVKAAPVGGVIYLKPGRSYSANALRGGRSREFWTTIAAAPGVARDQVEIGPGRPGTDKLRFCSVTLYSDPPTRKYNTILAGENGRTAVWVDDCTLTNRKGRWGGGGNPFGNRYNAYVTGGLTTEMDNGPACVLMRGHQIRTISSDVFTGARMAINSHARDIDPGETGAHPDFHQSHVHDRSTFKSVILYNCSGLESKAQGFFGHNLAESAFVNCLYVKRPSHFRSQYSGPMKHVLFFHITLPNQPFLWRDDFKGENVHVRNCVFSSMGLYAGKGEPDISGVHLRHNHFLQKKAMGREPTVGEALFIDATAGDYRLEPACPAARTGMPLQCVPADMDGKPHGRPAPSRGCYALPQSGKR